MKSFYLIAVVLGGLFFSGASVSAESDVKSCFCFDDITRINLENVDQESANVLRDICRVPANDCTDGWKNSQGRRFDRCVNYPLENDPTRCIAEQQKWDLNKVAQIRDATKAKTGLEAKEGLSSFIPSCAYEDKLSPECKDVGIFVVLLINISRYLFTIIGGLALLVFIYGGFILILSQGSSEQVQKGKDAMSAAVIGLIVAFSGYLLVNFLGTVVGVAKDFTLR